MLEFIIWVIIIVAIFMKNKKKAEQNRQNGQRSVQQRSVQQNYRPQSQADMVAKQRELKQRLQQKYAEQIQQQRQAQAQQQRQTQAQQRQAQAQQRPVQQMQQQNPQYRAPQPQQNPQYRAPQPQQAPQYRAPQPQQVPQYRAPQPQQVPQYRAPQPQQNMQKGDILWRASENVRKYEDDVLEKSELMEELNDLMLMGYQTNLSYERDFVAEGIELLNSYELPVA